MSWEKMGLVFDLSKHNIPWLKSHAMLPAPLLLDDKLRVYFSGRDKEGQSRISFVDFDRNNPSRILYIHDKPVLSAAKIGTFDDSGTLGTCAVKVENRIHIYYTAYSQSVKVPYRNSIGLAVSDDGGLTFNRYYEGPIVDRSNVEPYFTISPWVLRSEKIWHMWYASATGWIPVKDKLESLYHIKYASSSNGIDWKRENISCISPCDLEEANAKPTVTEEGGLFKMWFCYRGSKDFRDGVDSYKIGYAEAPSSNPTKWERKDSLAGISCGPEPYDDKMQAYPSVIDVDGKRYLFYNGNGFGVSGFCCAVWE